MLSKLGIKKAKNKYGFNSQPDTSHTTDHDSPDSPNLKHSVSSASSTNAHFLTTHNYLQPPPPASNQYSQLLSNSSGVSVSNNNLNHPLKSSSSSTHLSSSSSVNLSRKPTKREQKKIWINNQFPRKVHTTRHKRKNLEFGDLYSSFDFNTPWFERSGTPALSFCYVLSLCECSKNVRDCARNRKMWWNFGFSRFCFFWNVAF